MKNETEYKRGYLESGWCGKNISTLGQSYPYIYTNGCYGHQTKYACSEAAQTIDTSDYAQSYCLACGNFVEEDRDGDLKCMSPNACNRGSEFRLTKTELSGSICVSCSLSGKFYIGSHAEQVGMCESCSTTKRFYNAKYCYRCDDAGEFDITNETERSSCTKCPNRAINPEGKCVLIMTEE